VSAAIERLQHDGTIDAGAARAFVDSHDFPLVEGTRATFVYRGKADGVHLQHWIYGLPSAMPFARIDGTNLWYLVIDLPERSRFEYKLEIVSGDHRRLIKDPINSRVAHNPFGANSVCHGTGYETPEWTQHDPEARPGEIRESTIQSHAFGRRRRLRVYLPARFRRTRRYPLLIVHDAGDYLRYAALQSVLDNLIHRLEIPPTIVALTRSRERLTEYADDPRHATFLAEELVPRLESRYPLMSDPSHRVLMGASFGAVAALAAAWRYPGRFGRLLLQSGSFAFTDIGEQKRGPAFEPVVRFVNAFRENPGRPSERLFVSCGTYESLIYENRSMVPFLQEAGMEVRYVEARDGHNWENWRDRLREGLSWLTPGPLWMVYE
jgi:enterochelin esterase family protein